MANPVVHVVSETKNSNSIVASTALEIDPSIQIVEHLSVENFRSFFQRSSVFGWQIAVTDLPIPKKSRESDGSFVPVVYFSSEPSATGPNIQRETSIESPVPVSEIKVCIQEAIASAMLFKKLSSGLNRMPDLNEREHAVVSLAADGVPNKSIARRLNLSIKTIEQCRRRAYIKLGITCSAEIGSLVTFKKFFSHLNHPSLSPNPGVGHGSTARQ